MTSIWYERFPQSTKNDVEYLIDGTQTFKSIVDAIRTTKDHNDFIYILGWMLDANFNLIKSDPSTLVYELEYAAKNNVEIRILIWNNPLYAVQNKKSIDRLNVNLSKLPNFKIFTDNNMYSLLKQSPVIDKKTVLKALDYMIKALKISKRLAGIWVDHKTVDNMITFLDSIKQNNLNIGSHHEKIVIVRNKDNLISFCGGIDINSNRFDSYHDTHCKIVGPASNAILKKFIKRWDNHPEAKKITLKGRNEPISPEYSKADFKYVTITGTYNTPFGSYDDRSLRDAYRKIILNSWKYIYIEDQYLVNIDVAKDLNKKLQEANFTKLVIVIQDDKETQDIFIPRRKRKEFWDVLTKGITQDKIDSKIRLLMIDESYARKRKYHYGMHAKTLIADDEIAIIGTANVNKRSFSHDSETSVIIFDDFQVGNSSFAKKLRIDTWVEFTGLIKDHLNRLNIDEFWNTVLKWVDTKSTIITPYRETVFDADIIVWDKIESKRVAIINKLEPFVPRQVTKKTDISQGFKEAVDFIWDKVIDPDIDGPY